ncbi:MAG TPA: hypothetical protein VMT35_03315 [Ignavibacteriaceae bacterium]|nr:hypothetical protein [Ignavibacteriaceae bacterium]
MGKIRIFFFIIFFSACLAYSQYNGKNFSIGLSAVYTTTAKIYLNPNSSDLILRNNSFPLENIYNAGLDFRYRLTDPLILGFNIEYIKKTETGQNLTVLSRGNTLQITVEDGFRLIPLELSLYYLLPFSTENFKFLMGGGAGYYLGDQVRKFGDVEVKNVDRKAAYGIHVIISMDYLVLHNVSIRTEMKFRDPQFSVKSAYTKNETFNNGREINLPQPSFDSKINLDGITFILGAAFHF